MVIDRLDPIERDNEHVGLWGGRWQPPHAGHEWVLEHFLSVFETLTIAIVNPDPMNPPVSPETFPRFKPELNPLTFFERLELWTAILERHGAIDRVAIVPTWHPRYKVELENTFFPPKTRRLWIVPMQADEELMKVDDFSLLGEKSFSDFGIPQELMGISGSDIRHRARAGAEWSALVPTAIHQFGARILDGGVSRNTSYIIFPVLADHPSPTQLACASKLASEGLIPVFALGVQVQPGPSWWFRPAVKAHVLTYYERYCLIREVAASLGLAQPLITPIFYTEDDLVLNEAFLPTRERRRWIHDETDKSQGPLAATLWQEAEPLYERSDVGACETREIKRELDRYLKSVRFPSRRNIHVNSRRSGMGGGITFGDGAIIHGPVVGGDAKVEGDVQNVEGSQIRLSANKMAELREELSRLLDTLAFGTVSDLQTAGANLHIAEVTREQLEPLVKQELEVFSESRSGAKSQLRARVENFAISAASSGTVALVVEILKAIFSAGPR